MVVWESTSCGSQRDMLEPDLRPLRRDHRPRRRADLTIRPVRRHAGKVRKKVDGAVEPAQLVRALDRATVCGRSIQQSGRRAQACRVADEPPEAQPELGRGDVRDEGSVPPLVRVGGETRRSRHRSPLLRRLGVAIALGTLLDARGGKVEAVDGDVLAVPLRGRCHHDAGAGHLAGDYHVASV
jgi:hypothetical protein